MATNKTFGFGGDASRQADWSVRLPLYIHNKRGYMECFIVEGSTPLLVGRPIRQALKVQMNPDGPWTEVPIGERGEYLLRLDDGVEHDINGERVEFDYITNESLALISNYEDLSEYIDVHEYLSAAGRQPPEQALQADDTGYETASEEPPPSEHFKEDIDAVRKTITDKLGLQSV